MKVYISGKITGLKRQVAVANFARAEKYLKSKGYEVVNPTKLCAADEEWSKAMKICIPEMLKCGAIYLLPDWVQSDGAILEVNIAEAVKIKFLNYSVNNALTEKLSLIFRRCLNQADCQIP